MRLRHLAAVCLLLASLAACSSDDPAPESKPTLSSDSPNPDASLPAAVAEAVTPAHLDPVCANGSFTETDGVLGTLPADLARSAERILTYDCAGLIDQVVWAELSEPVPAGDASTFTAGATVLVVSDQVVDAGLDVTAYFEALSDACGCGSYDVTSGS